MWARARDTKSGILLTVISAGPLMNSFYDHHKDSIRWQYRCFDRILLNGLIQPFQPRSSRRPQGGRITSPQNEYKIPTSTTITVYAFSQAALQKRGPFGAA